MELPRSWLTSDSLKPCEIGTAISLRIACPLAEIAFQSFGAVKADEVNTWTFAIAAGISLYELARFLGTSVEQIDRTYGHLLSDSIDRARVAIDGFVSGACPAKQAENGG